MLRLAALVLLLGLSSQTSAVSVFPNVVRLSGQAGSSQTIAFKVYGQNVPAAVEIVQTSDLRAFSERVLDSFTLGAEQQRVVPITIKIRESKTFWLCAVLADSKSMRLRTCATINVMVP